MTPAPTMADRPAMSPPDAARPRSASGRDGVPDRVIPAVSRLLQAAGGLALLLMAGWTVTDIVCRLAFKQPLPGSIDLVEATLVLVVFFGLAEGMRRGEQITVDILDHVVPPRGLLAMKLFGDLATIAFLALLAWAVWPPLMDAYQFGDRKPDLPIPIYPLLLAIEAGLLVSLGVTVPAAVRHAAALARGGKSS